MSDSIPAVRLGDVLRLDLDRIRVEQDGRYQIAGVFSEGRGLFARETLPGTKTQYPFLNRLHAGQLVMRKLTAWEGTLAVVPKELDGFFVSSEFPTFSLGDRLLGSFIRLICQQPWFWNELKERSTGTVQRRKRVNPEQLLDIRIPCPTIDEQHRIVDFVSAIDDYTNRNQFTRVATSDLRMSLLSEWLGGTRASGSRTSVEEAIEVTLGRQRAPKHASGSHVIPYLRAANVKDGYLVLDDVLKMNFTPEEQKRFRLEPGDVLVTEGCGSLRQLGATTTWSGEMDGPVCFQNTLLRLRARPGITIPGFVAHWARYAFASGLFASFASGTNIFHLGAERVRSLAITIPPLAQQKKLATLLGKIDSYERSLYEAKQTSKLLRECFLQALLQGDVRLLADDGVLRRAG